MSVGELLQKYPRKAGDKIEQQKVWPARGSPSEEKPEGEGDGAIFS
jgi:hypothetical protein